MDMLKALKKLNPFASVASDGLVSDVRKYIDTGSYMLNAQISASIYGGFPGNRVVVFAGPPSSGKTYMTLNIISNYLKDDPNNNVIYFDTEHALETRDLKSHNIDMNRFYYMPYKTLEDFKNGVIRILYGLKKERGIIKDKDDDSPKEKNTKNYFFVLDSLGNMSTDRETDVKDAQSGKNTADMGNKAKLVRAIFRSITLDLGLLNIPMIVTAHTYEPLVPYGKRGIGGGQGSQYASSIVVEMAAKQDYEQATKKTNGVIITTFMRKARLSKQYTKQQLELSNTKGLNKYHGLLDFCLEYGIFKKEGKKVWVGNERFFVKQIEEDPERFFTEEVLKEIDEMAQKVFAYGFDAEIDIDDVKSGKELPEDISLDDLEMEDVKDEEIESLDVDSEL